MRRPVRRFLTVASGKKIAEHRGNREKVSSRREAKPKWRPAILDHLAPGQWLSIDSGEVVNLTKTKPAFTVCVWNCPDRINTIVINEPIQLRGPEACWPTGPVES